MLTEAHIIEAFKKHFPITGGIGDDAAILPLSETESYVITKDILIEDVHFRTTYFDAKHLAHKALEVNLSDIAAMGAQPKYILLGFSIPPAYEKYISSFNEHFTQACKDRKVQLIGGDTTHSPAKLFISVTAIGIAQNSQLKFRDKARKNNIICVAGNLGHAHLGLVACEKNLCDVKDFKPAFLSPQAKLAEGLWLAGQSSVTAMMDISDGLFIDLQKLCRASQLSAKIEVSNLINTPEFYSTCSWLELSSIEVQLTGGEDYGLLVTVEAGNYETIAENFRAEFGYLLKPVGIMLDEPRVQVHLVEQGLPITLDLKPFSHFGEEP
jgi:thiamine-monophosphate kinase